MNTDRYEGLIIAAILLIAFLYFGNLVFPKIQVALEKAITIDSRQALVAKQK